LFGIMLYYAKQPTSKRAAPAPLFSWPCSFILYLPYSNLPLPSHLSSQVTYPFHLSAIKAKRSSLPTCRLFFCPLSFTHPGGIQTRSSSVPAFQFSLILSVSFLLALRCPRMRFSVSDDKFIT
jgi:hypothetical protein